MLDNTTYKLMLKRHVKTGLMYLCQTYRDDYIKYPGSGTRWTNHLKVHGYGIHTTLLAEYPVSKEKEFGVYCTWMSKMLNVVKDPNFANLCEEEGPKSGSVGYKHTTKARDKISTSLTGREFSQEHRDKLSAGRTGKKHTTKARDKISTSLTGREFSEETRAKMSAAKVGKKLSQETRAKLSAANSGENNPNYGKTGENNPLFGRKLSEETCAKMSAAKTGKKHPRYGKGDHYIVTTPDGEVVYVEAISRWCKELGLNDSNLRKVALGKSKQHKGYTARFATEEDCRCYRKHEAENSKKIANSLGTTLKLTWSE